MARALPASEGQDRAQATLLPVRPLPRHNRTACTGRGGSLFPRSHTAKDRQSLLRGPTEALVELQTDPSSPQSPPAASSSLSTLKEVNSRAMEAPGFCSALAQQRESPCRIPRQQAQTFPRDQALHVLLGPPGAHRCSVSRRSHFEPRAHCTRPAWGVWVPRFHASLLRPKPWPHTGRGAEGPAAPGGGRSQAGAAWGEPSSFGGTLQHLSTPKDPSLGRPHLPDNQMPCCSFQRVVLRRSKMVSNRAPQTAQSCPILSTPGRSTRERLKGWMEKYMKVGQSPSCTGFQSCRY